MLRRCQLDGRSGNDVAAETAAALCIEAGADETLIPQWVEEGRRRAELNGLAFS
jgi:hypothetical protein